MKRKYLLNLLAFVLTFTVFSGNLTVYAANDQNTTVNEGVKVGDLISVDDINYINPLYEDIITEDMLVQPETETLFSNQSSQQFYADQIDYASVYYCSTYEEAGKMLLDGMEARNNTVVVTYASDTYSASNQLNSVFNALAHSIFNCAIAHNPADPIGGDYQLWSYGSWNASAKIYVGTKGYNWYITYTLTYYTDATQENWMNENVPVILDSLELNGKCTYSKIKAIYDYITTTVDYDHDHLSDINYVLQFTSYAALHDHTAVCQGYAVLLYRMLLTAGIDCRVITGEAGGAHAWNIVKIGDLWYNLDSTWDANRSTYSYFLLNQTNMDRDHTRNSEYSTTTFNEAYPMDSTNYDVTGRAGHDFVGTITKEPDIGVAGEMTYSCSCGLSSYSEEIPALPEVPATTISVTGGGTNRWVAVTASLPYNTKYSIVERGFVYIKASKLGSKELTVSTRYKVKSVISNFREDGTYSFSFTRSSAKEQYVVRAYVAYKDESGKKVYAYSDPYTVS